MRRLALGLCCALFLGACSSSGSPPKESPSDPPSSPAAVTSPPPTPTTSDSSTAPPPTTPTPSPTPTRTPSESTSPTPRPAQKFLPNGGTKIIGHMRIVAYYGVPGNAFLGVLGSTSPEAIAPRIEQRAVTFKGFGLPVQPAMELITTVAQGGPGPDGDYSEPIPHSQIAHYLRVAHQHKMMLILDLQPGRASFLSQAKSVRQFLLDPSVGLALDPEWKVGPNQAPGGGRIGTASAAGINAVGAYLSDLVRDNGLPNKLLIVHQFTPPMLPDRAAITQHPGVEMALHADGFGSPGAKIAVFHELRFKRPPFGIGFKLFTRQDTRLMTPAEVMRIKPRPDIITYQ